MSKHTKVTPASAREVREWAESQNLIGTGQRGRLGSDVIKAFNKTVSRGKRYPLTYEKAPAPTVKHTAKVQGRPPVTKSVNLAEVRSRALAKGVTVGARGRLPKSVLDAAVLGQI